MNYTTGGHPAALTEIMTDVVHLTSNKRTISLVNGWLAATSIPLFSTFPFNIQSLFTLNTHCLMISINKKANYLFIKPKIKKKCIFYNLFFKLTFRISFFLYFFHKLLISVRLHWNEFLSLQKCKTDIVK